MFSLSTFLSTHSCADDSYFGLSLWLPQHLQRIEAFVYSHHVRYHHEEFFKDIIFNSSLENVHFVRCQFQNVVFDDLILNHVRFFNSTFVNCVFNNTRSSLTRFFGCEFQRTVFLDTDLYEEKFVDCRTLNSTFLSTVVGCPLDFDINFRLATIFNQVLCTHVAVLPGTIITALAIDKLGRTKLLGINHIYLLFLWANSHFRDWFWTRLRSNDYYPRQNVLDKIVGGLQATVSLRCMDNFRSVFTLEDWQYTGLR